MLTPKKIVYVSLGGAAVLLLLPPTFLVGIPGLKELGAIGFQFMTGWIILGLSLFFHSQFYLKFQHGLITIGLSMILYLLLTGIDVWISLAVIEIPAHAPTPPVPLIPETFIQNLILSILSFIYVYNHVQRKKEEEHALHIVQLQNENLQLQLNSLQQQLNPHFFFNSLNTLSELIYIDIEKSDAYINKLSQVFRYILDVQQQSLISLEEELTFLQSYFYLLKIRFEDKLNLHCDTPLPEQYQIPSLSLLVLFENVIKHNAISLTQPMSISLQIEGDYLSVHNNKNPLPGLKPKGFGIGLTNLKNRCVLLTQKPCIVQDRENSFQVNIPLVSYDEHTHN